MAGSVYSAWYGFSVWQYSVREGIVKLLFCPSCTDVVRLQVERWKKCECGKSGGQYNCDCVTATVGGEARVFGIGNPFFWPHWAAHTTQKSRMAARRKWQYRIADSDCWWGEYSGDMQLFRILSADGPRLLCMLKVVGENQLEVTVTDLRAFRVAGKVINSVVVPAVMPDTYKGEAA